MYRSLGLGDSPLECCHLVLGIQPRASAHTLYVLRMLASIGSTDETATLPPAWEKCVQHAWGLGDAPQLHSCCCVGMTLFNLSTWEFVYCWRFCFVLFFPSKVSKYNHIKGLNGLLRIATAKKKEQTKAQSGFPVFCCR